MGTTKIIGKVHSYNLEIKGIKIPCSFTVIESETCEFLLGLDTLKRYQCILNLKDANLTFHID